MLDTSKLAASLVVRPFRSKILDVTEKICRIVKGPVPSEVVATDYEGMMKQAAVLVGIAIKVPATFDGLRACKALRAQDRMVNVTLCFSAAQALLAAKAGATFISPFAGRIDDMAEDGMAVVAQIRKIYDNYSFKTQILAASMRTASHAAGAHQASADGRGP